MDLREKSKVITNTRYNWVDTLIIAVAASSLQYLKHMIFKNLSFFMVSTLTIVPILYFFYAYVVHIRPILFSNPILNYLLLLPKDVKYRPKFTVLGLLATLFQWVGCMVMITSSIHTPWKEGELVLSSDHIIEVKAREEAERLYDHQVMKAFASAKPLDVTQLSPVEVNRLAQEVREREQNAEKEQQELEAFKKKFIDDKTTEITPSLKAEIHKEENEDFLENERHKFKMFWRQVMWGAIVLFLGAVIEKLNNIIQVSLDKKREKNI